MTYCKYLSPLQPNISVTIHLAIYNNVYQEGWAWSLGKMEACWRFLWRNTVNSGTRARKFPLSLYKVRYIFLRGCRCSHEIHTSLLHPQWRSCSPVKFHIMAIIHPSLAKLVCMCVYCHMRMMTTPAYYVHTVWSLPKEGCVTCHSGWNMASHVSWCEVGEPYSTS